MTTEQVDQLEVLIFDYAFKCARPSDTMPAGYAARLDALHAEDVDLKQKGRNARQLSVMALTQGAFAQVRSHQATLSGNAARAEQHLSVAFHNWFLAGLYAEAAAQIEAGVDARLGDIRRSRGDIRQSPPSGSASP